MKPDLADRHVRFEGCFNFRDIGGYIGHDGRAVRWSQYYRAARQDRMTEDDLARVRELSLRTQIDLRRIDELEDQGPGPLAELGARREWISVIPADGSRLLDERLGPGISGERYLNYLSFDSALWLRVFELIADPASYPVLVHCTAGKDRTGVTTALTLSVLGVDRATIEADYALTNDDVPRQLEFIAPRIERERGPLSEADRTRIREAMGVPADAIAGFLDGLDREYGGPLGYLRQIGVTEEMFESMRRLLLDPAP